MLNNKGAVASDETIKWIGYLAILVVASFAVWKMISKVMG